MPQPVIVALTDGFNNEKGSDTCGTNATRLESLLSEIGRVRGLPNRPVIFTVGLGNSYNPSASSLTGDQYAITEESLCGQYADDRINGGLERQGIDNVSLALIAQRGGGQSFVQDDAKGLAGAFSKIGVDKYNWYTVSYKVDPAWHRKSFKVELERRGDVSAAAWIDIKPNPWMDAPPPTYTGDGEVATTANPAAKITALFIPAMGLLLILSFVGPATFNARRAIFRRGKRGRAS